MENPQQKTRTKRPITLMIGILILMFACLSFSGSVMLDIVGAKAVGKLSNVSKGCSSGESCWTGKMNFTTANGQPVSFYPLTNPLLFDFDPALSGRSYAEYGNYQVRYLESYPRVAKVKLAFFLEYINIVCGLGLGTFITLIGFLSARGANPDKPYKPLVLDLSKFGKR
ncbi:MAG: hypothetical protein U0V02_09640 [Anaerolineales bacterium]